MINKARMLRISNYSKECLNELESETNIDYEQRKKVYYRF